MAIEETGSYIGDFSTTASANKPTDNPGKRTDGSGEIRQLKKILFDTFPEVDGPVEVTDTELGHVAGVTSAIQTQFDTLASNVLPAATKAVFRQTAAPTNWTKDTTYNDAAFRVTSGTISQVTGGDAFSTVFSASKATEDHTLDLTEIPSHTHSYYYNTSGTGGGGSDNTPESSGSAFSTSSAGGGLGHSHDITMNINYVDLIIATKDAW